MEILKGVEIPPIVGRGGDGKEPFYPLQDMGIGDCIEIPLKKNVQQSVLATARQRGFRVTTRVDLAAGVLRVWRVEGKV